MRKYKLSYKKITDFLGKERKYLIAKTDKEQYSIAEIGKSKTRFFAGARYIGKEIWKERYFVLWNEVDLNKLFKRKIEVTIDIVSYVKEADLVSSADLRSYKGLEYWRNLLNKLSRRKGLDIVFV